MTEYSENRIKTHFLYPATLFAEDEEYQVDTILGSCVAVCLYDKVKKRGGINHYMLPFWNGTGLASPKYGNIAIKKLIEKLEGFGCSVRNMEAKIFGGGEMLENSSNMAFKIGERNIEIAMKTLKGYGIPVVAKSVGGTKGRKIRYNTSTGTVLMKFINKS